MSDRVTSVKDTYVARVRALRTRAARYEQDRCVIEGALLVDQAIRSGIRPDFVLSVDDARSASLKESAREAGVPIVPTSISVLRHALRTQRPVDAVAVAPTPEPYTHGTGGDFALVLDGVVDPGNLGTIARTACALGVTDLVCTDEETDLTSRKVLDSSRCAVLRCTYRRYPTPEHALAALREDGFEIVATSPHGDESQSLVRLGDAPVALVLGGETDGVSEGVLREADHVVTIPMAGDPVESLNVGVAAGLSIRDLRRQQRLATTDRLSDTERERLRELLGRLEDA